MTIVFDGRETARKLEENLRVRVSEMKKKPRLVIVQVGKDRASEVYVQKKVEMGERIGVEVRVDKTEEGSVEKLKKMIVDVSVGADGVMVQLPIDGLNKEETEEMLMEIPIEKDVDGLNPKNIEAIVRGENSFVPATVKAIGKILDEALRVVEMDIERMKIGVVGAEGMVGKPLVLQMERFGFEVEKFEKGDNLGGLLVCDVVVSATGVSGLIKPEMVKEKVVIIDVGFPKGDMESGVKGKASFFTPVPGGVGPMTVVCLMENVVG